MSLKERSVADFTCLGLPQYLPRDMPVHKPVASHADGSFEAIVEQKDARLIVHVCGELDVATRPILTDALAEAAEQGTSIIYLDMAGLTFIDARGLGSIVSTQNALRKQFRHLALVNVPPLVGTVITIAGLSRVLDCHQCWTPSGPSHQAP